MKVSELKKGMLLECANDNEVFVLSGAGWMTHPDEPPWLMIALKRNNVNLWGRQAPNKKIRREKFVMYLGTKKDTNISMQYCDKFVLIGGKVAGVDPSIWCKLRSVK